MSARQRPMLDVALEAHALGLCVLPPKEDGSKRPDVTSWVPYQTKRSTEDELLSWYGEHERTGLGLVCGKVSGGLEMLELEGTAVAEGVKDEFLALAREAGLAELVARIAAGYLERTPKGGVHLLYRVPTPRGNTKLARRLATEAELAADPDDRIRVLIETRGEGGYVVTAPSHGHVHASKKPYVLERGGFGSIVTISDEERDALFRVAQALDRLPPPEIRQQRAGEQTGDRPGDRYNAAPDAQERTEALLARHGWTLVYRKDGASYWRRPGKQAPGVSASLGKIAPGVFKVFSTSTDFDSGEKVAYSPFAVLAMLEHRGDYSAAARALEPGVNLVFSRPADGSPAPSERPAEPSAPTSASRFPEPEDRGTATLSDLGDTEYVSDLIRPGRIVLWAAEEGTGKSFAVDSELGIRIAVAGGKFAETWEIVQKGPVLYLSEMHADDDFDREAAVLDSLGKKRADLVGRYFRLPLMTAAGDKPPLQVADWRSWIVGWMRERQAIVLIFDTATGAAQVDPWGAEIQGVYRDLRAMIDVYPDLAVVLIVHLKKPQGKGERRLSDVLGEWGRWCDVVVLHENDGAKLDRAKITVRKRVKKERRVLVTKRGGLLVDPQDISDIKPTKKVSDEAVLAAIAAQPGLTFEELGAALKVSSKTAKRYVKDLGEAVDLVAGTARSGPAAAQRVFPSGHLDTSGQERDVQTLSGPPTPQAGGFGHLDTHPIGVSSVLTKPDAGGGEDLLSAAHRIFGDDLVASSPETIGSMMRPILPDRPR